MSQLPFHPELPMNGLRPEAQGLYDPAFEHDACGVGFIVDLKGRKSHKIVSNAVLALINLDHRGAVGADAATGDGAGILIQIPHGFLRARCQAIGIDLPGPGQYGVGAFFCSPQDDACISAPGSSAWRSPAGSGRWPRR